MPPMRPLLLLATTKSTATNTCTCKTTSSLTKISSSRWQKARGFVGPEDAKALRDQVKRTQADLDQLRNTNERWGAQVDNVISAFNASEPEKAREAFAEIHRLINLRRRDRAEEQRRDDIAQARALHAEATLLYPHEASRQQPNLKRAAELAKDNVWYWIDYGRVVRDAGDLNAALQAFTAAKNASDASDIPSDKAAALNGIGDVRVDQGDLPGALGVYEESLTIARDLLARDPGNAGWARDVVVSYAKLAQINPGSGFEYWSKAHDLVSDMHNKGILAPVDAWMVEETRAQRDAARK